MCIHGHSDLGNRNEECPWRTQNGTLRGHFWSCSFIHRSIHSTNISLAISNVMVFARWCRYKDKCDIVTHQNALTPVGEADMEINTYSTMCIHIVCKHTNSHKSVKKKIGET